MKGWEFDLSRPLASFFSLLSTLSFLSTTTIKKHHRQHNVEAALVALVVGRLAYETVRWFLERRRKRRRGGGGGAAPAA